MKPTRQGEADSKDVAGRLLQYAAEDLTLLDFQLPTASQVRLKMGELSNGGFSLSRAGYKNFRSLVQDAELKHLIRVDRERRGDYLIIPAGMDSQVLSKVSDLNPLLWRCVASPAQDRLRAWDAASKRAIYLPKDPFPMEPPHYSELRKIVAEGVAVLPLPHVNHARHIELLRQAAGDLDGLGVDENIEPLLSFQALLKKFRERDPKIASKWFKLLADEAYSLLENWARSNDITWGDLNVKSGDRIVGADNVKLSERVASHSARALTDEEKLRSALHSAIDRLPLEGLRLVQVPSEALISR